MSMTPVHTSPSVDLRSSGYGEPAVRDVCHHVMIVDNDSAFAQTVVDAVADTDIEALAVSDPREALNLIRRRPFAVAVVDLTLAEIAARAGTQFDPLIARLFALEYRSKREQLERPRGYCATQAA